MDDAAKKVAKMTDKEVQDKYKEMLNAIPNTEADFVSKLPSNNGQLTRENGTIPEGEVESEKKSVVIDPATGEYQQQLDDLGISKEMADMLELKPEDLLDIPDSINDIDIPDDILTKNIQENGIEDVELASQMMSLVKEYRKMGDPFRGNVNWYKKLPEKIRTIIDKQCAEVNNNSMGAKKTFAEAFIQDVVNDAGIDSIVYDMQKSMEEAFDTSGITEYILSESKTDFEKNMEATMERTRTAENIDEEKRSELLDKQQKVLDAFHDAYSYESFINAIKSGKVRVKPFDIHKYARWLKEFYNKYEGDTPFVIKDPSTMAPILKRFFPEYSNDQCIAFVIAFIKFTRNMNPNDVVDHTYMSYFIHNISQLDLVRHKASERDFINILSNNIKMALDAVNNIKSENESEE